MELDELIFLGACSVHRPVQYGVQAAVEIAKEIRKEVLRADRAEREGD